MRAETTRQILGEVTKEHRRGGIDVFLSYFYNAHFDPAGFDELRRTGIPSINFYCNSIYQFELVSAVAAKADYAWHAERDARPRYLSVGASPVWVQMGADPNVYHPVEGAARRNAACFVGQRYADRDRWMASLIKAEVPVEIYGPGWRADASRSEQSETRSQEYLGRVQPVAGSFGSYLQALAKTFRCHGWISGSLRLGRQWRYRRDTRRLSPLFERHARGPIPFEKISEIFGMHDVCINFSNVWADGRPGSDLIPHVRLRDFEAPMCRTCYLTGETEEIHHFYEVGHEVDTYSSAGEFVDKVKFYLRDHYAAERLRENGYRRARAQHTWSARFTELLTKTGIA